MAVNCRSISHLKTYGGILSPGLILSIVLSSCAVTNESQLPQGRYLYRMKGMTFQKAVLSSLGDSVIIHERAVSAKSNSLPLMQRDAELLRSSFDSEVFWTIGKFRPAAENLPRQLNTELNGNLYAGWRWDRYKNIAHGKWMSQSISLGAFAGIGTTRISSSTTNHRTTAEYQAAAASYGLALLSGFSRFSYGLAIGTDHLWSDDRSIWIYHRKAWYGLTLGIKLR